MLSIDITGSKFISDVFQCLFSVILITYKAILCLHGKVTSLIGIVMLENCHVCIKVMMQAVDGFS